MSSVRFRDLSVQNESLKAKIMCAVERVLSHGIFILGHEVEAFERAFVAAHTFCHSVTEAVGVGSGTDALVLALKARGVLPGDRVAVPALSWIATANAVVACGAEPIFVDVEENDVVLDFDLLNKLDYSAVMPVHFLGRLCDQKKQAHLMATEQVSVIEDASQAFGAHNAEMIDVRVSHARCFSLNPMKVFGGVGEAGIVLSDSDLAEQIRLLRSNGVSPVSRTCERVSTNFKIDALQAAIMHDLLESADTRMAERRRKVEHYMTGLSALTDAGLVRCLPERPGYLDSPYTVTILCDKRDELQRYLSEQKIETQVVHAPLMPAHPAYMSRAGIADSEVDAYQQHLAEQFPNATRYLTQALSLPLHDNLRDQDIEYVCQSIANFMEK